MSIIYDWQLNYEGEDVEEKLAHQSVLTTKTNAEGDLKEKELCIPYATYARDLRELVGQQSPTIKADLEEEEGVDELKKILAGLTRYVEEKQTNLERSVNDIGNKSELNKKIKSLSRLGDFLCRVSSNLSGQLSTHEVASIAPKIMDAINRIQRKMNVSDINTKFYSNLANLHELSTKKRHKLELSEKSESEQEKLARMLEKFI